MSAGIAGLCYLPSECAPRIAVWPISRKRVGVLTRDCGEVTNTRWQ